MLEDRIGSAGQQIRSYVYLMQESVDVKHNVKLLDIITAINVLVLTKEAKWNGFRDEKMGSAWDI